MRDWKEQFGNVYTMWLGPLPVVLVCDYQTAHDAFIKNGDAHAGRQVTFVKSKIREGFDGLIHNEGPGWQEQRRFSLQTLRNFGVGKNIMQLRILEEANFRFEKLDKQIAGEVDQKIVIDPAPLFDLLIGSIVNKLLAGYRYDESNIQEFRALKHNIDVAFDNFTAMDFIIFNEFTYKLPILRERWNVVSQPVWDVRKMMKKQIEARQAAIESGQHVLDFESSGDDYIDAFLIEIEKRKQNNEELGSFNVEYLATNLMDLWTAGMETTISTLLWTFIYLLNYPEVQEKARKELFSLTQGNRSVELMDKPFLPYTNAVITESLRCGNVLNFNLFHKVTTATVVGDFLLPKGTITTYQQSVIMTDENAFSDAQKFNPERFLQEKTLEKQVIPFGIGKRSCLGESLARAELFLIIANFLQRYEVSTPEGCDPPSMQQIRLDAVTKRVIPYKMVVRKV